MRCPRQPSCQLNSQLPAVEYAAHVYRVSQLLDGGLRQPRGRFKPGGELLIGVSGDLLRRVCAEADHVRRLRRRVVNGLGVLCLPINRRKYGSHGR